jgi:transcriptional regulator with XRE-family HTH domain
MLEGGVTMTTLRQLRISRGLQQKFISESCGINNNQLVRYESGENKPCLSHAIKIAEFYGIKTVAELKKLFEI